MARQMREEGESSSSSDRLPGKQDPTGSRARISLPRFFPVVTDPPLSLSDELFLALALVWCGWQAASERESGRRDERERARALRLLHFLGLPPCFTPLSLELTV
jgi:hypothetical protein